MIIWRSIFTFQMLQQNRKIWAHPFPRSERVGIRNQDTVDGPAKSCTRISLAHPWEMLAVGRWMKPMTRDLAMLLVSVGLWWTHVLTWMWVKMEDLGDHRCSSLVCTIQLLGYLILTHTHI